jgi:biopolymer transport protein TolR
MGMSTRPAGGKSRRHRRGSRTPMSEINVTPFVDVMLVLLIIFMVAAPLLTAGVPLELPSAKGKQLQAQKSEPVVVSVTREGQIYLGDEQDNAMALEALTPKLKSIMAARGSEGGEQPIFVRGDEAVPYGTVARVMAEIREAGFRKLSLVTQIEQGG